MPVKIAIDSRMVELPGESIVIGRGAAAQLSLPDSRLFEQHAVLRQVAGRWLIEAQGEAVISVGNGRPTKVAWLSPDDVIRLTETGPTLTFEPTRSPSEFLLASTAPAVAAPAFAAPVIASPVLTAPPAEPAFEEAAPAEVPVLMRASQRTPQKSRTAQIPSVGWIGGGAAIFVFGVIIAVAVIASQRPAGVPAEQNHNAVVVRVLSQEAPEVNLPAPREEPARPPAKAESKPPAKVTPATVPAERLTAAVHLVLVSAPDRDQTYRLGAAWAVGKRKLVTSGAVGQGLLQLREELPMATVQGNDKQPAAVIKEVIIHPEFRRLAAEATAAQTELDELRTTVEESTDPDAAESLEPKMVAVQNRLLDALQQQLDFDVAVLEVDRDLPAALEVAETVAAVRPGAAVRLVGIRFPMDEFLVDPEVPVEVTTVSGQVQAKVPAQRADVRRWLVKFREAKPEENWSGSPVVNAAGQVIGVYSRPTPPMELREDYIPTTHEITAITRLAEIH